MTRFVCFTLALMLALGGRATLAFDASLYPEAAPEDAVFVRFVGYEQAASAEFAGMTFALHAEEAEAYIPVSAARLDGVPAGSFVTVVDGDAIFEAPRADRSKVHLFLVNATGTPLDLRVVDGSVPVIEGVAPMGAGTRAVNPLRIRLGVYGDANVALSEFDVAMQRGQNLSFFADARGVRLIEHRFAAVAK